MLTQREKEELRTNQFKEIAQDFESLEKETFYQKYDCKALDEAGQDNTLNRALMNMIFVMYEISKS